jgi:hypothetical protein
MVSEIGLITCRAEKPIPFTVTRKKEVRRREGR